MNNSLFSISPIDGRYEKNVRELQNFFSEYALIYYRVYVEIEYLISLTKLDLNEIHQLNEAELVEMRNIYKMFNEHDAKRIK
jgi:adenylosuccinate lyase